MRRRTLRFLALVAAIAAVAGVASTAAAPKTIQTPCGRVLPAASKLGVNGNHMAGSDGTPFVPYGISVVSGPETKYWAQTERAVMAQIVAAQRYWHANAIRIQVSEAQLLDKPTPRHSYNVPFAASVDRLVCKVLAQGQIPIVNDTTLFTTKSRGPTARSVRFWNFMSERYGNKLPVVFDVFNEPRLGRNPRTNHFYSHARVWQTWQRGGAIAGRRYLGMQTLIDAIRVKGRADNVIWVEEPWYLDAEMLPTAELPQHLLRGTNIVYAFHKVTLDESSKSFRALAAVSAQGVPLVDSEWSQFAAVGRPWECQDDAYKGVPSFLEFAHRAQIGLLGWSLQPGALVKGQRGLQTVHDGNAFQFTTDPRALRTPNAITASYGCDRASLGQGAGALLMDFFARDSRPAAENLFPKRP